MVSTLTRVGTGYDVHAFAPLSAQRPLLLGGVVVPHDRGLAGHSDADVLLHAVVDALLGAVALGDIGTYFPSSDERESAGAAPRDNGNRGDAVGDRYWSPPNQPPVVDVGDLKTQDLPPDYFRPGIGPLHSDGAPPPMRVVSAHRPPRRRRRWIVALSVLLLVAVVGGGVFAYASRSRPGTASAPNGCASGTPCQVANTFLAAYAGGNYEAMYQQTSTVSQTRFNDPKILGGVYKTAHDYIVQRTAAIVTEARIYSVSFTADKGKLTSSTTDTVTANLVYQSSRVGMFEQTITVPLLLEHGHWHVQWSPGLIFSQMDDAADPTYQRKVHLFAADGTRGSIYDRDGNVLARDDTVYTIGVVPGQIADATKVQQVISTNLDFTPDQVKSVYAGQPATDFVPVRTINAQLYQQVRNAVNGVPGIVVRTQPGRVYPYGEVTAPVTGYVSDVSQSDLQHDTSHYYGDGDVIGRAGVEAWGEQYLRPVKGGALKIMNVNADGSYATTAYTLASRDPINGADIHTTISLPVQQATMAKLNNVSGHSGGAIGLDPATGEVIAMGSAPFYDPNDLALGFTPNGYARFTALDHPYIDRALDSAQPTGSVFKIVTLATALQNGIGPSQVFTCAGTYQVPGENHLRNDDNPTGHGTLTPPQALAPSCDVVFWQVAVQLNAMNPMLMPTMARSFGYGARTGIIGISPGEENPGIVPDPAYLLQHENAKWTPTDAANLGTGQGFLEVTPIQAAVGTAALANNDVRLVPRLVTSVVGSDGTTLKAYATPVQAGTIPLTADNLSEMQGALLGPTTGSTGTATPDFAHYPVQVAGKTGTAESGQAHPHSWFTCYAPASAPKIAIGALVEYSDFGEAFAVPVSKAIMDAFFHVQG